MPEHEKCDEVKDLQIRVRALELGLVELKTILKQTNKILGGIATMIGGVILKFIVDILAK